MARRNRETEAAELLAVLLRAGLQGHSRADDAGATWRDDRLDQFHEILTDRGGGSGAALTGSAASAEDQLREFRSDVSEHLDYLEAFQGLDLGSWLQALLHSRFVARILRKQFNYVHSFIVLRETKPSGSDEVLVPFLLHERNAPRFPSGEWVLGEGDAPGCARLSAGRVARGLREYARRLHGDRNASLVETFHQALAPWLDSGSRPDPPRFAVRRDAAPRLAVFFSTLTLQLLRGGGRSRLPRETVEELPCAIHRLLQPREELAARDRPAFHVFALSVMERASFRRMAERSSEILQPLLERSVNDAEKTELERRSGLTYFDASRLTFQAFAERPGPSSPKPRTEGPRCQALASWLWRKVQSSRLPDSDDRKRGRTPDLEQEGCRSGLARLGCATSVLDLGGSESAARSALRRFEEWEWSRYRAAPRADAGRTSPWTRDMEALPLAKLYESLGYGFSIAVHATGPVNRFGEERPQLESFRIDIVKDTAETDPDPWDPDKVRRAIRRTLQLDRLFSQAEMLAVDTQRRRILEAAAKEHERGLRLYTAWNAHELQYELKPLLNAVFGTRRLSGILRPFAADERAGELDPTAKIPRPQELDDAAFSAMGSTLMYLASGFVGRDTFAALWREARTKPGTDPGGFVGRDYDQMAETCREFIRVTQEIATLHPENAAGAPVLAAPAEVLRNVVDSQRRRADFRKDLRIRIDDRRLGAPVPFPKSAFRHAILPELLRNAFKYARSFVELNADIRTDPNGVEFLRLHIANDDNGTGREERHEGGRQYLKGAIRANLGLKESDGTSEFYTYGRQESGDYFAEVRFPFDRYVRCCLAAAATGKGGLS